MLNIEIVKLYNKWYHNFIRRFFPRCYKGYKLDVKRNDFTERVEGVTEHNPTTDRWRTDVWKER